MLPLIVPAHRSPGANPLPAGLAWLAMPLLAFILIALALAWPGAAHAGAPRTLRFERIGLEEGLPQESVNAMLQDRTGFMWFGTQGGLARFDGYRTRVFRSDPADPRS